MDQKLLDDAEKNLLELQKKGEMLMKRYEFSVLDYCENRLDEEELLQLGDEVRTLLRKLRDTFEKLTIVAPKDEPSRKATPGVYIEALRSETEGIQEGLRSFQQGAEVGRRAMNEKHRGLQRR